MKNFEDYIDLNETRKHMSNVLALLEEIMNYNSNNVIERIYYAYQNALDSKKESDILGMKGMYLEQIGWDDSEILKMLDMVESSYKKAREKALVKLNDYNNKYVGDPRDRQY